MRRLVADLLLLARADAGRITRHEPVDVARARLLADLTDQLGFDEDAVETVVDLLDQVHTLRRQLHQLGLAIGRQPTVTRESIAGALKDLRDR